MMKTQNTKISVAVMLIVAALGMGTARAQQWQRLQAGTCDYLYGICCVDEETVFACGSDGQIVRTTDGGASWTELYSEPGVEWYKIRFLDGNTGFALGNDYNLNMPKLMKTEDGGATWQEKQHAFDILPSMSVSDYNACDLILTDANTVYVACNNLLKSTDGGETFFIPDESVDCFGLPVRLYIEDNTGYLVVGVMGGVMSFFVLKSEDYGNSWNNIYEEPWQYWGTGIPVPHFIDKNHIDIFGEIAISDEERYDVLRTENGFSTIEYGWSGLPADLITSTRDGKFTNPQNGVIILSGESPSCAHTAHTWDGGMTWESVIEGLDQSLDLFSIDGMDTTFYMTSENGVVYKWGRQVTQETVEEQRSMVNLTPNPAQNEVVVTGEGIQRVEIHNLLGQRVVSVEDHSAESLTVSLEGLPQGVYLVSVLLADGKRHEKKLVVR